MRCCGEKGAAEEEWWGQAALPGVCSPQQPSEASPGHWDELGSSDGDSHWLETCCVRTGARRKGLPCNQICSYNTHIKQSCFAYIFTFQARNLIYSDLFVMFQVSIKYTNLIHIKYKGLANLTPKIQLPIIYHILSYIQLSVFLFNIWKGKKKSHLCFKLVFLPTKDFLQNKPCWPICPQILCSLNWIFHMSLCHHLLNLL